MDPVTISNLVAAGPSVLLTYCVYVLWGELKAARVHERHLRDTYAAKLEDLLTQVVLALKGADYE